MAVIHGLVVSFGLLLADSQPVTSYNPTATLWVTCRHEKICICNTRCCKSIFVIYSPLTSVNTNYRVSKFNWKCLCWFRITISPLLLCRTDSNPSIAASTSIANIETIFSKSSYIKSAPICIGCASSCLRDRKNIVNNVKSYRESNCISTSSPLFNGLKECN